MSEYSDVNSRQSYVSKSGRDWENYVRNFLNSNFKVTKSVLQVLDGKLIRKSKLWKALAIKVDEQTWIEGDVDLVVISTKKPDVPLAVISCKTSLHGRFSETLFYAIIWKQKRSDLKVVFATPDKGRQANKSKWSSEWGTKQNPTKDRFLAEKFLDGVYIKNNKSKFGGKIKPLKELPKDLKNWYDL